MKKIFNLVYILTLCLLLCFTTSCGGYFSGEKAPDVVLEEAMEKLKTSSYTIETNMTMEIRVAVDGEVIDEKTEIEMRTEADPNQSYVYTNSQGIIEENYTVIEDGIVKVYALRNNKWILIEQLNLDEYEELNKDVLDLETENCFEYNDGEYIGDVEILNQQLEDYMESFVLDMMGPLGESSFETEVEKYNITLENNNLSTVDIIMNFEMEVEGVHIKVRITMPMEFSKIGETEVTVPKNLND